MNDYLEFLTWLRKKHPQAGRIGQLVAPTRDNYKRHPLYSRFKEENSIIEPVEPVEPPSPIERWKGLSDQEREVILTGETDPTDWGYPAFSGYTWVNKYDPVTRTNKWVEEPKKETTTTDVVLPGSVEDLYNQYIKLGLSDTEARAAARAATGGGKDSSWSDYYNQQMLELTRQKFERETSASQKAWAEEVNKQAYTRWLDEQKLEFNRQEQALKYKDQTEDWNTVLNRKLAELDKPRDFIKRWFLEQEPNPNEAKRYEKVVMMRNDLEQELKGLLGKQVVPEGATSDYAQGEPMLEPGYGGFYDEAGRWSIPEQPINKGSWTTPEQIAKARESLALQEAMLANLQDPSLFQYKPPPMPSWMGELVSGPNKRTISKDGGKILNINPASLNQYSPTQWSMLAGLSDYWGDRPLDEIIWESESMIPTGSVGRRRWRPASQIA